MIGDVQIRKPQNSSRSFGLKSPGIGALEELCVFPGLTSTTLADNSAQGGRPFAYNPPATMIARTSVDNAFALFSCSPDTAYTCSNTCHACNWHAKTLSTKSHIVLSAQVGWVLATAKSTQLVTPHPTANTVINMKRQRSSRSINTQLTGSGIFVLYIYIYNRYLQSVLSLSLYTHI